MRPIEAKGKISVPSPISVQPSTTADAPTLQFGPRRTFAPMTASGPIVVPAPTCACGCTMAVGSIWVRSGTRTEQEIGFGDDLIADVRDRLRARERGAPAAERDLQPQPVAGHDLPAELRVVHAAQIDAGVGRRPFALQQQNRRHLRQRLEHQHAGQRRRAREVALKEFLVDRDVLDGDETPAGLVLGDRVDEHRRIPVAQPVEEDGDVDHAPLRFGAGAAGRWRGGRWPRAALAAAGRGAHRSA